jgi:hypothetical protein
MKGTFFRKIILVFIENWKETLESIKDVISFEDLDKELVQIHNMNDVLHLECASLLLILLYYNFELLLFKITKF